MPAWVDQIPLPLWTILALAALLLGVVAFVLWRWFRLKAVKVNVAGTTLEFERKGATAAAPSSAPASGISQEVTAGPGGSVQVVEQKAEGSNIQQKINSQGQITGVKQNADNR